jgi:hypothetical protein
VVSQVIQLERPRSIEDFVTERVIVGTWREEVVPAEIAGTSRDLVISHPASRCGDFRVPRKVNRISLCCLFDLPVTK